jgi:K+-transporting ATPase ATPase C chain
MNNSNDNDKQVSDSGGSFLGHLRASIAATIVLCIICCGVYPAVAWLIAQTCFPNQANGSLIKKDGTSTTDASQAVGSSLIGQNFSQPSYFHPRPSNAGGGYDATASGGTNLGPLSDQLIDGKTNAPTTQPTTQPESLAFDGVRLRTLRYCLDNGISFKLYRLRADGAGDKAEILLSKFQDAKGNLNDVALVDAFPHPQSDSPDRMVLVAGDFTNADGKPTLIPGDAVTASASGLDPHISPANARLQLARVAKARNIDQYQILALVEAYTDGPNLGFLGDPGVNVVRLNLALDVQYPLPAAAPH